ncbi:uncharacterized protein At5g23160 [Carica papaya]|uniref:uncharacterized protein At5g23160 n=1 Tax=Carica papaya TaxID=3649 RepID=UPI000B8D0F6E|nr:uncharacterized protein At5g23160 [Carica papaya]
MAATRKKNKPKAACFLGCFGFSEKMLPRKSEKNRKSTRWLSWSRFRMRRIGSKTVPVDSTVTNHKTLSEPLSTKQIIPSGLSSNQQAPRKVSDRSNRRLIYDTKQISPEFQTRYGPTQDIILDNDEKYPNRLSFDGKTDPRRIGSSQPDVINARTRNASSSHSISLPVTTRNVKPVSSKKKKEIQNENGEKIDPIFGLSIVMVSLVIMLLWGRLCAILCTSAWCYCVSCVRTRNQRIIRNDVVLNSESTGEPDLSSSEYKKKVVLEGFMKRKQRRK